MEFIRWVLLGLCCCFTVFAAEVEVIGSIQQSVQSSHPRSAFASSAAAVTLLKMHLSENVRQKIAQRAIDTVSQNAMSSSTKPAKIQLGMNNVPVLNQGSHPTCATFACAAAIDAALNQGDYVSELCQLQLGRYLEKVAYTSSGWDGLDSQAVLSQMAIFGIVNKQNQRKYGCGQLTEYPLAGPDPITWLSVEAYSSISESLSQAYGISWSSLLDMYQAALDKTDNSAATLVQVKKALQAGNRVVFGTLIVDFNLGLAGAVAQYHVANDTWVLTAPIVHALQNIAADGESKIASHTMVIFGYDDDAIAIDKEGNQHKGLLTLRSSWGEGLGDQGNFYMSYDYFKIMAIEAQCIRRVY